MKLYRETIVAGKTILQAYRASTRVKAEDGKRRPRTNPTPEAVRKINLRNAVRNLTAILNHNFGAADYHLTLTYAREEPTKAEARKNLQNFLRNMKNYCRKHGHEWKWVTVTEYENHRIHHHVVCSGVDPEVINEKWKYGWVNFKALDDSGNYYRLAEYLVKETEKTFRSPDAVSRKRYSHSRTIVIPEIRKEEVSARVLDQDPKPLKGYYIDRDTIARYEHAVLGVECVEFIQVSLEDIPRIRKWRGGKKTRKEKHHAEHWPRQLDIWEDESIR